MQIKLRGKINSMNEGSFLEGSCVQINLELSGAVKSDKSHGKEADATMILRLKPLYAEQLKFGQVLNIEINTDE